MQTSLGNSLWDRVDLEKFQYFKIKCILDMGIPSNITFAFFGPMNIFSLLYKALRKF